MATELMLFRAALRPTSRSVVSAITRLGFLFCPHVAHATVGIPSLASIGPIGAVPSGHMPLQTPNSSTPHIPAISGVLTSFSPIHCAVHLWDDTTHIRAQPHTLCNPYSRRILRHSRLVSR